MAELCPPRNSYAGVLTPSILDVIVFEDIDLKEIIKLK